ncbi:MAG: DUF2007 domain-containing protein [Planctomycetes bacterium]|nr:DUF2007 domain-containing protein [Planctomycetota bacterium]
MNGKSKKTALIETKDRFQAEAVILLLQEAEIPVFVAGRMLQDEFAISQMLMNIQSTTIEVPEDCLEKANAVIREAREAGQLIMMEPGVEGEPSDTENSKTSGVAKYWFAIVVLLTAVVIASFGWFNAAMDLNELKHDRLTYSLDSLRDSTYHYYWKSTDKLAYVGTDENLNGIPEKKSFYNFEGVKLSTSIDANEDGISETGSYYGPDGALIGTWYDKNEDGWAESVKEFYSDNAWCLWTDTDGNGTRDLRTIHNESGEVVRIERDGGVRGFIQQK